MAINLASLIYAYALVYYAKKRGGNGRYCLIIINLGFIPLALSLMAQSALSSDWIMFSIAAMAAAAEAEIAYDRSFDPTEQESEVIGYIEMYLGEQAYLSPPERRFFVRAMRHARALI